MTDSLAQSLGAGNSSAQWATDFLSGLGAPTTPQNVQFVESWMQGESGHGGGQFNPLNSTQGAVGATNLNSVGVKNYVSYQQGIQASVATFTQTQWASLLNALKANDQGAAVAALESEYASWGGSINLAPTQGVQGSGDASGSTSVDSSGNSSSSSDFYGCPEGKIWDGPSIGGQRIYLTKCQGRAILGGVSLVGGAFLMVVGLGFVAIGGKTGRAITGAVGTAAAVGA